LLNKKRRRKWSGNTAGISKKKVAMDSLSREEEDGKIGF